MKTYKNGERFDRSKFIIAAYYLMPYAQTEEHVKLLKEASIDAILAEPRNDKLLDLLHKYGIGIFPKGIVPQDEGGQAEENLSVEVWEKSIKETYKDHPAIWGAFAGDEPRVWQMPVYGQLIEVLKRLLPGQIPHLNMLGDCYQDQYEAGLDPVNQGYGAKDYKEFIDKYVENIDLPYIGFDNYVYIVPIPTYLENFEIIANKCRETGRDLWFAPQCNNQDGEYPVTENMLRYQVYLSLAYGCKCINWACWTKGWWENNVIDTYGNVTDVYYKVKNINLELRKTTDIYMEYKNMSTHYLGFEGSPYNVYLDKADNKTVVELKSENNIDLGEFKGVAISGGCAVVGHFKKPDGGEALMIVDHSDPRDIGEVIADVTFKTDKKVRALYNGDPIELENKNGEYNLKISHCCGVFITLE